jgi:medium-chain acyl-[acyl-carrier-protein] hydrolase
MPECLVCFEPQPAASVDLVCIPWAGAGAAPFHSWSSVCAPSIELVAVRRAGRERRLREAPMDDVADVVAELADGLTGSGSRSIVLFGHCVGGIIAFELARELRARGSRRLRRLVVFGTPAPSAWRPPPADGDLVTQLRREGLTDESLFANTPIFEMLRPGIEADLRLGRGYVYRGGPPLDVPITLLVSPAESQQRRWLPGWAVESSADTVAHVLPQGNLYPTGSWLELASAVAGVARGEL